MYYSSVGTLYIYLGSPSASASESGYLRRGCPYTALHCAVAFRGDIIVMRPAAGDNRSFVNMRGRDSALSDFAVTKYFLHLLSFGNC